MATLVIPHSFVPGTPALASEVNANFQAVVSWTQGQISTDNLGILGARSVALPTSPTFAILSLSQPSSNIALNISNAGTESSIVVNQSGALANGKASILINSPSNQSTSGAAELLMDLNTNASIPAILVKHGAAITLQVSRTKITLGADLETDQDIICSARVITKRSAVEYELNPQLFSAGSLNSTAAKQIDWNDGPVQQLTLNTSGSVPISFVNPVLGGTYLIKITRGNVLNGTISWPISVKWSLTGPPSLSASDGKIDLISFIYDGTTYYGTYSLGY